MRPQSLSGRKNCDFLLRKGNVWKGKTMMARWLCGTPRNPNLDPRKQAIYIGTYASTKLSKLAVDRNRMRRRCREALRLRLKDMQPFGPAQLLVTPRSASLEASFADIASDAAALLSLLVTCRPQAKNHAS